MTGTYKCEVVADVTFEKEDSQALMIVVGELNVDAVDFVINLALLFEFLFTHIIWYHFLLAICSQRLLTHNHDALRNTLNDSEEDYEKDIK